MTRLSIRGLARYLCLAMSVAVFLGGMAIIEQKDRSLGLRRIPRRLEINRGHLQYIAEQLRVYERAHGRYPSNDEGLASLRRKVQEAEYTDPQYYLSFSDAGLITIWGEPFVYENRREYDAGRFHDSGADDGRREYAVRVDDGVFVWSIGARDAFSTYEYYSPRIAHARTGVMLVSCALLLLYVTLTIITVGERHTGIKRIGMVLWSLLGGTAVTALLAAVFFPMMVKTCYVASVQRMRTPKLTSQYIAVLEQYHDRGIIGDSAYKKITKAMEEP